jgi:dsRNA-specific ribonuclease
LQELIKKEFKTTPHYAEIQEHHSDLGYHMGVYLCLGQPIHSVRSDQALPITHFRSHGDIHQHMSQYNKIFVFLGEGLHKIKKKAEQIACEDAIAKLNAFQ